MPPAVVLLSMVSHRGPLGQVHLAFCWQLQFLFEESDKSNLNHDEK